jgi:hypothetical protein
MINETTSALINKLKREYQKNKDISDNIKRKQKINDENYDSVTSELANKLFKQYNHIPGDFFLGDSNTDQYFKLKYESYDKTSFVDNKIKNIVLNSYHKTSKNKGILVKIFSKMMLNYIDDSLK